MAIHQSGERRLIPHTGPAHPVAVVRCLHAQTSPSIGRDVTIGRLLALFFNDSMKLWLCPVRNYNKGMRMLRKAAHYIPSVTFWGAARSVTGSMHLVEWSDERILLDCGIVLGRSAETHRHNREFPFVPATI